MPMNYEEVLSYLYTNLPMFQRMGGMALKKDLSNTLKLCAYLDHPERKFRSVHIAGTNGKGSSSHYLASILQEAGYRVGLYTSPHLKSFTERIRINGRMVDNEYVTEFVNEHRSFIEELKPSFFEITVGMAFDYFARQQVDVAVIEVGMGGRLDSTNVITPEAALITNISYDHQQWLGDSLTEIAGEKAGIIKEGIPVVIGENQPEVFDRFRQTASGKNATLVKAWEQYALEIHGDTWVFRTGESTIRVEGAGLPEYQQLNLPGVLALAGILRDQRSFRVTDEQMEKGIRNMKSNTGLMGRWQVIARQPKVICDVGHNEAGFAFILKQLKKESYAKLYIILGMVSDKDIMPVLKMLPPEAGYYFCQANIPRALDAGILQQKAEEAGLHGVVIQEVNEALAAAREQAGTDDLIFVGGSNFVVAELNELT